MSGTAFDHTLILVAAASPAALFLILGALWAARMRTAERTVGLIARAAFLLAFVCYAVIALRLLATGRPVIVAGFGEWFRAADHRFRFELIVGRLSIPFALFSTALVGVVAAFANRYVHRERGFHRFFILLSLFATGMTAIILAGNIGLAFAGWELVGLSSALLIAFFHERPAAVENGFRALVVYRVCDVGFLTAAVLIYHWTRSGDFIELLGTDPWPGGTSPLSDGQSTVVMALILLAVMGKCAQIPFSGWLPRAMEGPTPSSAIFYGALSVHAGVYLMLRFAPMLERAPIVAAALGIISLATALMATFVGRVQTDIKSALAYATLTQVSLILLEVALGLYWLAVAHTVGHACIRSLQFLRAPSLLHDMHSVENAVGGHLSRTGTHIEKRVSTDTQRRLYRFSLERAHLDNLLDRFVVEPFLGLFRRAARFERQWMRRLEAQPAPVEPASSDPALGDGR